MKPILFKLFDLEFPAYNFMITVGIFVAAFLGIRVAKSRGLSVVYAIDMAILGIIFGFLGGRVAHVLFEAPSYYLESPIRVFYIWQGGFVSWGGYTAILLSWFFYLRWRKEPILPYLDGSTLCFPMAMFFGRIGCLLGGCCFGKPTDFAFHLTFINPQSTAYHFYPHIPLHATQIYLMLNALFIQFILWFVARYRWRFLGELISLFFILYAVGRFSIEFLRGDVDRGLYFEGLLSSGQIVMLLYFFGGCFLYLYFKKRNLKPPAKITRSLNEQS